MKINENILKGLMTVCGLNESYSTVKDRFINDGADKTEVKSLLDLHKKLKDLRRLKDEEINIDSFVKNKSFDEFKSLMSRYSEKDTKTKTVKFTELKNKIVAENDDWVVYDIDNIDEAYLFHGLANWCIVSGNKASAQEYFDHYYKQATVPFYFIVRKHPKDDEWDYIAFNGEDFSTGKFWNKFDKSYMFTKLPKNLNIPKFKIDIASEILKNWKLNKDGFYDVSGDVDQIQLKPFVKDGKLTIKFNKVSGNFLCHTLGLDSLVGCPKEVGKHFNCSRNKLTSLEGAPEKVGKYFNCDYNQLTSLKGSPQNINDTFDCSSNQLTSLKGAPKNVGERFNCSYNKLTSLKDAPETVGTDFYCEYNKLTSLEGAPKEVGGSFICMGNPGKFTKEDIRAVSNVKEYIYI